MLQKHRPYDPQRLPRQYVKIGLRVEESETDAR